MFGWVRVKGSEVTEANGTRESPVVSGGDGIQTTNGRGGAVKVMDEGTGLTMVAVASMVRF
jgi:hypothetical protein